MCEVLAVSESGYYRSLKPTPKGERKQRLLVKIKEIIEEYEDNNNYGVQRILLALSQIKITTSYSTVYRIMKKYGLLKKVNRHPNGITRGDAAAQKSENLIQRDFSASAPNQKWQSDITEIPCLDGKLYLSAVLDCYNGEIVGLAMDDNMRKELCIQAFENACKARDARGMIYHSDRGSQFTSQAFRACLAKRGAIQSMSGTGRCYDNARMESFTFLDNSRTEITNEKLMWDCPLFIERVFYCLHKGAGFGGIGHSGAFKTISLSKRLVCIHKNWFYSHM